METLILTNKKGNPLRILYNIIVIVLLAFWLYVLIEQLTNLEGFKTGISRQPLPVFLILVTIYLLPVLELFIIISLMFIKLHKIGLFLSVILMTAFTIYVGTAILGLWNQVPCTCGSVIKGISWKQHFFFNLFFLVLSVLGYYFKTKLRHNNAGGSVIEGLSAKRHNI